MGQGAVGAALPRQGVEGACHEGTQEQQHFNLAKYSLCSSVDLRQMALNGKAETCRAKRWTPCREYPSTRVLVPSTLPSVLLSSLSPFVLRFLPGLVKLSTPSCLAIVERRLHCRPPAQSLSLTLSSVLSAATLYLSLPFSLSSCCLLLFVLLLVIFRAALCKLL